MIENEKWVDMSTVGSPYEEWREVYSGRARHRRRYPWVGEWQDGPPPSETVDSSNLAE